MPRSEQYEDLVERYRSLPEFISSDLSDPNQHGITGDTLLHVAVVRRALDDVNVLLTSGADINATGDLGNTPLHYAASRGLIDIAIVLLNSGADPALKNEFGQTPHDLAVLMKKHDLAKILEPRA